MSDESSHWGQAPTGPVTASQVAATAVVAEAPSATPAATATTPAAAMSSDEIAAAQAMIQSYSGYPGVQSAFASMVAANGDNPERLGVLVREMLDQIEQVRANPHAHQPVNPEIAAAIEAIRKVELEKPDPLNLLRPDDNRAAAADASYNIFTATAAAIVAPAREERPDGVTADRMPFRDMGDTLTAIALLEQFRPQPGLPDISIPDPSRTRA
ncbi:MAG: hypothetical protein V4735_08035 [Pseudomonadota bacterium]